jgi:hypothetical protein
MATRVSAVVLALTLAAVPCARGETNREQAAALLREGVRLHDRGDYPSALEAYVRAQRLYASYKLHYNIGLTLEAMGRLEEAAARFELFLKHASATDAERTESARGKLQALVSRLGVVTVRCPVRDAAVAVDGRVVGRTPLEHRIYLRPGRHRVTVDAPERPRFVRAVDPAAGVTLEVSVPALPAPPPVASTVDGAQAPPRPRSTPIYRRWWFWTIVGAVVVGGTVGAVVAARSAGDSWMPSGELTLRWSKP